MVRTMSESVERSSLDLRYEGYQMHQQGMSLREISRCLHVSRNAVRRIVKQEGKSARRERSDKKQIDPQLLERLYRECDGWMQHVQQPGRPQRASPPVGLSGWSSAC